MIGIDLDTLDPESLEQLRTMLDRHDENLTPAWQAIHLKLSSTQSAGSLPTPTSTPQREQHHRSASGFDFTINVPPRPDFQSTDSPPAHQVTRAPAPPVYDNSVEYFLAESTVTYANQASAQVFDDSVEAFFADSALSDDEDTDRGRAADRQPQERGSSCHRGGVVPPPGMIHFAHAQQRVQQARAHDQVMQDSNEAGTSSSQTSNSPATQHSTSGAGSMTTTTPQSHIFSFTSPIQPSPYANYNDPYFRPIEKTLITAVTRLCGKASRLLYDEAYTKVWDTDIQHLLGTSAHSLGEGASEDTMSILVGLGNACLEAHRDEDRAKFVGVLASLSLAAKVQALMEKDNVTSLQRVWEVYVLPLNPGYSFSKWERWFVKGKRWALVGQAGGIYLVLLIIFARETSTFENVNVTHMVNMGYHIRAPRPGLSLTRLFASTLAPSIKLLQDTFPVDSCRLFDNETLRVMKVDSNVRLEDWVSSDAFFKAFKTNTFHLPSRDLTFWARGTVVSPVYTSVSLGSLLPSHDDADSTLSQELEDPHEEDTTIEATSQTYWTDVLDALAKVEGKEHLKIKTGFKPDHPRNKFKLRAPTRKKTLEFTKAERALAECAYVPKDFKDFSNRLASQLAPGYREEPSHYVLLDRTVIMANDPNKFTHIGGHDGLPFVISLPPAPKEYADIIIPIVEEIFPSILRTRDSDDGHRFFVLHHTFYNRSATRGTDAPSSGDPWKHGKNGKKRIDPSQCLPRLSTEGQDERLETLKKALQGLMDWLTAQLLVLLKEHYTVLDAYITVLPGPSAPAVYPFGGMVLNFNVSTLAHRDHGDKRICLVLAAQDGEGGDIVLYEPGLVVRMYTGHSLVFRSCDITHFNLPYKGKRVSFVFHSDHDGTAWVDNRNGWKTKEYFSG